MQNIKIVFLFPIPDIKPRDNDNNRDDFVRGEREYLCQ